jgi:Protein of unknown function (DUF2924)
MLACSSRRELLRYWRNKQKAIMARAKDRKAPKVGVTFERTFNHKKYQLKVVSTPDGIGYDVGGQVFRSPSAAAKSITKISVNGWRFWHMDRD